MHENSSFYTSDSLPSPAGGGGERVAVWGLAAGWGEIMTRAWVQPSQLLVGCERSFTLARTADRCSTQYQKLFLGYQPWTKSARPQETHCTYKLQCINLTTHKNPRGILDSSTQKPWTLCTTRMFPPITRHPLLRLPKAALIIWKDLCGTIKATLYVLKAFLLTFQASPQTLIMKSLRARTDFHFFKQKLQFLLPHRSLKNHMQVDAHPSYWEVPSEEWWVHWSLWFFLKSYSLQKVNKQTNKTTHKQTPAQVRKEKTGNSLGTY